MRPSFCLVLAGLLALAAPTTPLAQTVSSTVEGSEAGVFSSDPQGPSSTAVTSDLAFPSAFTVDFSGEGFGRAVQRPDGVGAVLADGLFSNGNANNFIESRTLWTDSDTNTTGGPVVYEFQFLITPPSLRIGDFAGLEDTDPARPDISYQIVIRANGVPVFESEAHLIGGFVSHVLNETGTSLSPTFVGGGSVFGYDFQPYTDVLNLGSVPNGGTMTVEYEMVARVDTPGFEAGGRTQVGDPFDLDGTPGFTGTLFGDGVVPVESSTWGEMKGLYR